MSLVWAARRHNRDARTVARAAALQPIQNNTNSTINSILNPLRNPGLRRSLYFSVGCPYPSRRQKHATAPPSVPHTPCIWCRMMRLALGLLLLEGCAGSSHPPCNDPSCTKEPADSKVFQVSEMPRSSLGDMGWACHASGWGGEGRASFRAVLLTGEGGCLRAARVGAHKHRESERARAGRRRRSSRKDGRNEMPPHRRPRTAHPSPCLDQHTRRIHLPFPQYTRQYRSAAAWWSEVRLRVNAIHNIVSIP
jgi:hypothetical protein